MNAAAFVKEPLELFAAAPPVDGKTFDQIAQYGKKDIPLEIVPLRKVPGNPLKPKHVSEQRRHPELIRTESIMVKWFGQMIQGPSCSLCRRATSLRIRSRSLIRYPLSRTARKMSGPVKTTAKRPRRYWSPKRKRSRLPMIPD